MSAWKRAKRCAWLMTFGIACAGGGFLHASKVTNPCIGRPVTETMAPKIVASLAGRIAPGEVFFEGFYEGLDGRVRWKDGCGNQTEEPIPLGEVVVAYWIQAPDGTRVEGARCRVTRPGTYTGCYQVSSSSGAESVARFPVVVPAPDWEWIELPQVQVEALENIQFVAVAPHKAFYPLVSALIPGVRTDRNGIFANEVYPLESQFRMSHRWALRQIQSTALGAQVVEIASGSGLSVVGNVTGLGSLHLSVDTVVETSQPAWRQQYQNVLPAAEISPIEVTIRGTPSGEDDVLAVTRDRNGQWAVAEGAEISVRLPGGFEAGEVSVQPSMAAGSQGLVRFDRALARGDSKSRFTFWGWATKPSRPGIPDRITFTIWNEHFSTTVSKEVVLLPMALKSDELVTLHGHPGDAFELCHVPGIPCTWIFSNPFMNVGTFDYPDDSQCSFIPRAGGVNQIQMWIGNSLIWERPVLVYPVISREEWNAVAPKPHKEIMSGFQHLTLHHSSNTASGYSEMRRIQRIHMSLFPYNFFGGKDFYDIGYHFVVDKEGRVFEGRRLESAPGSRFGPYTKGEHVGSNNTVAGLGLCMMGDFESTEGDEQLGYWAQVGLQRIIAALCLRYRITAQQISYHRVLSVGSPSLCPGSNFIPKIPEIIQRVSETIQ